jgi:hypothetical protein
MEYKISEQLLRGILTYLANQRFNDVSGLINSIQNEVKPIQKEGEADAIDPTEDAGPKEVSTVQH